MGEMSLSAREPLSCPLLPDRDPQRDFFVCDIINAAPKADVGSMEHPIFSLSTKPDLRPRHYEHNGLSIDIKPSSDGIATVHDRDILIFCISQLIRALNDGREVSQLVRFQASDLLRATNRMTTGRGYDLLKANLAQDPITGPAGAAHVASPITVSITRRRNRPGVHVQTHTRTLCNTGASPTTHVG